MTTLPNLPALEGEILLDVYTHKSLHHEETIHNDAYGDNSRLAELGENVLSLAITQRLFWVKPMLPTADIVVSFSGASVLDFL